MNRKSFSTFITFVATLSIFLSGYAAESPVKQTLTGTKWTLTELMGQAIPKSPKSAYIIFQPKTGGDENQQFIKGRINGSGGCNHISGAYALTPPNQIHFQSIIATMMACQSSMKIEGDLLQVLNKVDSYTIKDNELQLFKARMAPLARFESN